MSKPKPNTEELDQTTATTEREDLENRLEGIDKEKIDQILTSEQMNKGGKIRIMRKGPLDQTHQYVITMPVDQWDTETSFEYIKKMFGGGDYKCQTFRASGAMYKPFEFSIDHRFKGQLDEDEIKRLAGEKGNSQSNDMLMKMMDILKTPQQDTGFKSTDMLSIIEKSGAQTNQMMMMFMAMMNENSKQSQQMFANMMTAMATMFSANKPTESGTLVNTLLSSVLQQKTQPMNDAIETMIKMKELFSKDEQPDKEETMLEKLFKYGAPVLAGVLNGGKQPVMQTPAPKAQLDAGEDQQQHPVTSKLGGLYAMMPAGYKLLLDMMFAAAEKGSDPALYADIIYDQIDDNGLAILKDTLTQPDWCAKLVGNEQLVAHIRPWLNKLREILLSDGTENNIHAAAGSGVQDTTGQPTV